VHPTRACSCVRVQVDVLAVQLFYLLLLRRVRPLPAQNARGVQGGKGASGLPAARLLP
jgi:hypothetical protein